MSDLPERIGGVAAPLTPVDAHDLLSSASVISMGLATLGVAWESIGDSERRDVLERLRRHADDLTAALRALIQPDAL